jgi:hypothetical protein
VKHMLPFLLLTFVPAGVYMHMYAPLHVCRAGRKGMTPYLQYNNVSELLDLLIWK